MGRLPQPKPAFDLEVCRHEDHRGARRHADVSQQADRHGQRPHSRDREPSDARLERGHHRPCVRPGDAVGHLDVVVKELAQPVGHRLEAEGVAGDALRPAEVSHYDDLGAGVTKVREGRQGSPDPTVIGDDLRVVRPVGPVGQGHVEVRADQHGPPGDLKVVE